MNSPGSWRVSLVQDLVEEAFGALVSEVLEEVLGGADPLEEARTALVGLLRGDVLDLHGSELDVLGYRHVQVEVELLEDHADLGANLVDVRLLVVQVHPVHDELA